MLSLADTSPSCSSSSNNDDAHSYTRTLQQQQQQQQQQRSSSQTNNAATSAHAAAAAAAAPWAKHAENILLTVPPGSAVLAWSGTAEQLLAAAPDCSRTSCYVHVALTAAGVQDGGESAQHVQEATVWLAPFGALKLPPPDLRLSNFRFEAKQQRSSTPGSAAAGGSDAAAEGMPGGISFTVSSSRVALFAVWEMANLTWLQLLPGHFSQNAVTVHPCEPRTVQFIPRLGSGSWRIYSDKLLQWQLQHQTGRGLQQGAGAYSSSSGGEVDVMEPGQLLASLLQQGITASSLHDHQQFESRPRVSDL
jgi:hypothetical protein